MFEVLQSSVKVLNIISLKTRKARGGLIFEGAYNWMYFFGLQVDGPLIGGGGGGGLISGSFRYAT